MIAFLDLETTGLSESTDSILEVACIVTTDQLEEVAAYHSLVTPFARFHELDPFVRDMHTKNGLWDALTTSIAAQSLADVEKELAAFLRKHTVILGKDDKGRVTISRAPLAGNSIGFDRGFLKNWMPQAEAELHYRNFDVSSINILVQAFWPKVWEGRPRSVEAAHRAMDDVRESLETARYYARALGPAVLEPTQALTGTTL